jgi:hypothetical protein
LITGSQATIGTVNARTNCDFAITSNPPTCSGKASAALELVSATASCVRTNAIRRSPNQAKLTPIWFALLLTSSSAKASLRKKANRSSQTAW